MCIPYRPLCEPEKQRLGGVHIQAELTRRNIDSVAIRENKGAGSRGRIGRGFNVPALTGEHLRRVVCPRRRRMFRGRYAGLLPAGSRTYAIPMAQPIFRSPMQHSAQLARASTRMQSGCSFSKVAMRHPTSGSCQRKGLGPMSKALPATGCREAPRPAPSVRCSIRPRPREWPWRHTGTPQ